MADNDGGAASGDPWDYGRLSSVAGAGGGHERLEFGRELGTRALLLCGFELFS